MPERLSGKPTREKKRPGSLFEALKTKRRKRDGDLTRFFSVVRETKAGQGSQAVASAQRTTLAETSVDPSELAKERNDSTAVAVRLWRALKSDYEKADRDLWRVYGNDEVVRRLEAAYEAHGASRIDTVRLCNAPLYDEAKLEVMLTELRNGTFVALLSLARVERAAATRDAWRDEVTLPLLEETAASREPSFASESFVAFDSPDYEEETCSDSDPDAEAGNEELARDENEGFDNYRKPVGKFRTFRNALNLRGQDYVYEIYEKFFPDFFRAAKTFAVRRAVDASRMF